MTYKWICQYNQCDERGRVLSNFYLDEMSCWVGSAFKARQFPNRTDARHEGFKLLRDDMHAKQLHARRVVSSR